MKKEVERLQKQYKDILNGKEIVLQMEKSDPYDNRSPRMYRIYVVIDLNNIICEFGYCKNKEKLIQNFENKLKELKGV